MKSGEGGEEDGKEGGGGGVGNGRKVIGWLMDFC